MSTAVVIQQMRPRGRRVAALPDSGSFSEATAPVAPQRVEPQILGTDLAFLTVGSAQTSATSRIQLWGPYEVTEAGTVDQPTIEMIVTTPLVCRATLYQAAAGPSDDGIAPPASVQARPLTHIASGVEQTCPASGGVPAEYVLNFSATGVTPGWYWIGLLTGGSGAATFTKASNSSRNQIRTNSGTYTYHITNSPPAFPASGTSDALGVNSRMWMRFRASSLTAPGTPTATVAGDRSITIAWAAGDARTHAYQVERQKNGGAWAVVGVTTLLSYRDGNLERGASYAYRVAGRYGATVSGYATSSAVVATGTSPAWQRTTPTPLSATAVLERVNAGAIKFRTTNLPAGVTADTAYARVGFDWSVLEPTQGNYNFSVINTFLDECAAAGQLGAIRVRCVVSGSGRLTPSYSTLATAGATFSGDWVPLWNDSFVIARIVALYTALGAAFNNDSRVGFVDVGMYGDYGEWRDSPGGGSATYNTLKSYLDACLLAFPNKRCVLSSPENDAIVAYGMATYPNLDTRSDALGSTSGFFDLAMLLSRSEAARRIIRSYGRARTCEHLASGSLTGSWASISLLAARAHRLTSISGTNLSGFDGFTTQQKADVLEAFAAVGARLRIAQLDVVQRALFGSEIHVAAYWANDGAAAVNDPWSVVYQLRAAVGGALVEEWTSALDLRDVYPTTGNAGCYLASDTLSLAGVARGNYTLNVTIPGYIAGASFLRLAQSGLTSTYYQVGTIEVV